MDIYALPKNIYRKVKIDVGVINGIYFKNLDEYLYRFPKQKRLVSSYVKKIDGVINISTLSDMFSGFADIEYFKSDKHAQLLLDDALYDYVYHRYVKNPLIWITTTQMVQAYYFDSKYLKIGKFQKIARKNTHQYFNMQSTSPVINYSKIRTLDNIHKHNQYFLERYDLEGELKNFIWSQIGGVSDKYDVIVYDTTIEIHIKKKNCSLQIEFNKWDCVPYCVWGSGLKKKSKSKDFKDIWYILDDVTVLNFYMNLFNVGSGFISSYVERLEHIKNKHRHTLNLLVGNIKYTLQELFAENRKSYIGDSLNLYMIHHKSVERIHLTKTSSRVRVSRTINYGKSDEFSYCSYTIDEKGYHKTALRLFEMGFINVSLGDTKDGVFDYDLLASGKQPNFILSFMKTPTSEAFNLFADYEKFLPMLDEVIKKEPIQKDTRVFKNYSEIPENTYFELVSYKTNKIKHIEEKPEKQAYKYELIKGFVTEYKDDIKYFS